MRRGPRGNWYEPAIDDIVAIIEESGKTPEEIARQARLSTDTVAKLISGQTKSPHHTTLRVVAEACGYEFMLVPLEEDEIIDGGSLTPDETYAQRIADKYIPKRNALSYDSR